MTERWPVSASAGNEFELLLEVSEHPQAVLFPTIGPGTAPLGLCTAMLPQSARPFSAKRTMTRFGVVTDS